MASGRLGHIRGSGALSWDLSDGLFSSPTGIRPLPSTLSARPSFTKRAISSSAALFGCQTPEPPVAYSLNARLMTLLRTRLKGRVPQRRPPLLPLPGPWRPVRPGGAFPVSLQSLLVAQTRGGRAFCGGVRPFHLEGVPTHRLYRTTVPTTRAQVWFSVEYK